ncbi:MAG: MoaD/ThiS family protein [Planctomycetota bacterium]|nr:MoaD/ThiS family protein [Planctomycetota bacterium]
MKVTLRYHALLREKTGRAAEALEFPAGATVAFALERFASAYPALDGLRATLQAALNDEFARPADALRDGDTLDLFPPFGGG